MVNEKYIEIYKKSLENNYCFEQKTSYLKKMKIILYYLVLIFANDYLPEDEQKIHIINSKTQLRLSNIGGYVNLYYGILPNKLRCLKEMNTVVSKFTKANRIQILFKAIRSYHAKISNGNLAYWIDFNFWCNYLCNGKDTEILSNGHYDRLTTMLSYLCESEGIAFSIQQHGLIAKEQNLPVKIFCNQLYAFDDNEIAKFKKNVILNETCIYHKRYINDVRFVSSAKDTFTIGIIEQPGNISEDVISMVLSVFPKAKIIIMLHPLSKQAQYKKFADMPNLIFSSKEKEWNLDLLVSTASTLAYDYIQNNFQAPILFVDVTNVFPDYRNSYKNLIYIESMTELKLRLKEQI